MSSNEGVLSGLTIIVTGSLPGYTRKATKELVESHGGIFSNSIRKPKEGLSQVLVLANNPGKGKVRKAEQYGITQQNGDEFLASL